MVRSSYVRFAYVFFIFLTISIFHHDKVKNGAFSRLYGLSSPLWPCFFHSIVRRLHLVVLKEILHFCTIPTICYFPMLPKFLIRVACLDTSSGEGVNCFEIFMFHGVVSALLRTFLEAFSRFFVSCLRSIGRLFGTL